MISSVRLLFEPFDEVLLSAMCPPRHAHCLSTCLRRVAQGPRQIDVDRLRKGEIVPRELTHNERVYDLVVVDEAHHIYEDPKSAESVSPIVDGCSARVFLSDESQALGKGIDFPEAGKVHLTEVVRSSKRIITAAASFQLGQRKAETRCFHESEGMPLRSYIFEVEGNRFQCYASQTLRALQAIQGQFKGLSLHNRLAIIVPDPEFRDHLQPMLLAALAEFEGPRRFQLVDSQASSACIEGLHTSGEAVDWLVFDEIASFDGLERLIVVAVGLDTVIERDGEDTPTTRSRLYRALTRAQMLACVVNEVLVGGWLEFLTKVQLEEGAFNEDEERAKLDLQEAQNKIQSKAVDIINEQEQLCELAKRTIVTLIQGQKLSSEVDARGAVQTHVDLWTQYEAGAKVLLSTEAETLGLTLNASIQQKLSQKVADRRLRDNTLEEQAAVSEVIQDLLPAAVTEALTAGPGLTLTKGEVRLLAQRVVPTVQAGGKLGTAVSEAISAWQAEARPICERIRAQSQACLPEELSEAEVAGAAASVSRTSESTEISDDAVRKVLREEVYPARIIEAFNKVGDSRLDHEVLMAAVLQSLDAGTPVSEAVQTAVKVWQEHLTVVANALQELSQELKQDSLTEEESSSLSLLIVNDAHRRGIQKDVVQKEKLKEALAQRILAPRADVALGTKLQGYTTLKKAPALLRPSVVESLMSATPLNDAVDLVLKNWKTEEADIRCLILRVAGELGLPRELLESEVDDLISKVAQATRDGKERDDALRKLLHPIVQDAVVTSMVEAGLGDGLKGRHKDAKALALELAFPKDAHGKATVPQAADELRKALEPRVKALALIYAGMRGDAWRQDVKAVYEAFVSGPQDSDGLKKAIDQQMTGSQLGEARRK